MTIAVTTVIVSFILKVRKPCFSDENIFQIRDQHPKKRSIPKSSKSEVCSEIRKLPNRVNIFMIPFGIFPLHFKIYFNRIGLNEYSCQVFMMLFQVDVTHPARIPRPKQQFFKIPLDRAVEARISPEITTTSNAVKKYSPTKRNCYFTTERFLRYFNTYTQQNCQIECKVNYTIHQCGCVNFYMPSKLDYVG